MASKDPEELSLLGSYRSNLRWSTRSAEDRRRETKPGLEAMRAINWERWLSRVDPDGTMDPDERAKCAVNARAAHMAKLSLKSAQARRAAKAARAASAA